MVLLLSALALVRLFRWSLFFIWSKLCWYLLCSVLCVLVVMICLTFLVAKYWNVFCFLRSKCLIAFLCLLWGHWYNILGPFLMHSLGLKLRYWFVLFWMLCWLGLLVLSGLCIYCLQCYVWFMCVLSVCLVFCWGSGIGCP